MTKQQVASLGIKSCPLSYTITLSWSSFGLLSLSDVIIHHSVSHSMFADDTEMRIIIIIIIIGDSADSSVGEASD